MTSSGWTRQHRCEYRQTTVQEPWGATLMSSARSLGNKNKTVWLFATLEVSSRLWAGCVLGRRSDHNARAVINDVVRRGRVVGCPLIATDGFEYYLGAVGDLVGPACVYGQVLKTRRNNRVIRVERRVKIGTASRLQAAVWASGGFRDPEHLVRRAAQPHDSASVGVPTSAIALPRPWRRPPSQPRRARALPLQLRPTAPGVAVRARNQDASHAGWSREHAIGPERHLHSAPCHSARVGGGRRHWRGRVADALVAARTTNGCLINSERRKHR